MKKYFSLLWFLLWVNCGPFSQKLAVKPVSAETGGLIISIDPRIELLNIVQHLGGFFFLYKGEYAYKNEIDKYFEKYKEHAAVTLCKAMTRRGGSFDAPPTFVMHLDSSFTPRQTFTDYLIRWGRGNDSLILLASALREFAIESRFAEFYNNYYEYYHTALQSVLAMLNQNRFNGVNEIRKYYGVSDNRFYAILSMMGRGNFGPMVKQGKDFDVYSIIGIQDVKEGVPVFGSYPEFEYLVWHEFSHSFVNPITAKFSDDVDTYNYQQAAIKDAMKSIGYADWVTIVNEHIVRAVTARLAFIKYGDEKYKVVRQKELALGFKYIKPICISLAKYEKSQTQFAGLQTYYKTLLKAFEKPVDIGDVIPSISLSAPSSKTTIIIYPTHETDTTIQGNLNRFISQFQNKFYKDSKLISDKEALVSDLKGKDLIVFGTLQGNEFFRRKFKKFPLQILADRVIGAGTINGRDLRVIAAWRNPDDKNHQALIYTGQKASVIENINQLFAGETNYVIGEGKGHLESGYFLKTGRKWKCVK